MSKSKLKPILIGENEQEMDKISTEMAIYFEKRITASSLAKWLSVASGYCIDNPESYELKNNLEGCSLVNLIGFVVLPGLISSNTREERIAHLKGALLNVFENSNYAGSSQRLKSLGVCFLNCYTRYRDEEDCVTEFMNIYTHILYLCKMFSDYEYYANEKYKENKREAA